MGMEYSQPTEYLIKEQVFQYFFVPYLKYKFAVTTKRIIVEKPNHFMFIPTGKSNTTYPLRNISSVTIGTIADITYILAGLILGVFGYLIIKNMPELLFDILGILIIALGLI